MILKVNNKDFEIPDDNYYVIIAGILKLTNKEVAYLKELIRHGEITTESRKLVAMAFDCSVEEVNTYIARLRKKKAIIGNNYHVFFNKPCNLQIEWK